MRNRFLTLLLALIFIFTLTPHSFATEIANNTQITTATPTDLEPCFIIQSFTDSTGAYSVQKFNDRIYYVNAGHGALSDKTQIKLSGKISDEVKFNKIFTGKDDASWFDLSQDGAVEVLNDSFIIDLNKAYKAGINPDADNNLIYSTGSGCYSVLQKLQAAEAVLYRPVSGGGSSPKTMTISFKLLGALDDGEDGAVNTLMDNNLEEWYSITETFNADSLSAEEVFRIIMGDAGIEWRGNSQNQYGTLYVSGIRNPNPNSEGYLQWMEELSTTPNSGWMYTVNGKHPGVGLTSCLRFTIINL